MMPQFLRPAGIERRNERAVTSTHLEILRKNPSLSF
jgi:hypothetical protein